MRPTASSEPANREPYFKPPTARYNPTSAVNTSNTYLTASTTKFSIAWHHHPLFIEANARHVRAAIDALPPGLGSVARVVFTAHSIPATMAGAERYRTQLLESARLVAERLGVDDWALAFQSRSGRPGDVWLEPDICTYLRAERACGLAAAVVCPIGFVCDHVEVLYDLDIEAAEVCREVGLPMARAATVNDDPLFLAMMADEVVKTWNRYRTGRPLVLSAFTP